MQPLVPATEIRDIAKGGVVVLAVVEEIEVKFGVVFYMKNDTEIAAWDTTKPQA